VKPEEVTTALLNKQVRELPTNNEPSFLVSGLAIGYGVKHVRRRSFAQY
jgi:hypothetical protein